MPACRSFDCVSVFARDVATAAAAVELAAGYDADDPWSPAGRRRGRGPVRRLGVPTPTCSTVVRPPSVVAAFAALDLAGFEVVEVDLDAYLAAGDLLYGGAFVAERHAAVGAFVDAHPDDVDPVVGAIIAAAGRPAGPRPRRRPRPARRRCAGGPTTVWDDGRRRRRADRAVATRPSPRSPPTRSA